VIEPKATPMESANESSRADAMGVAFGYIFAKGSKFES
jgi:hypothetical protein